jgi:hypothetical protein
MAANLHFQVDLQDDRATARKTKTVFQRALHGRWLDDTLPVVAVLGARSRKERAFFLVGRARSLFTSILARIAVRFALWVIFGGCRQVSIKLDPRNQQPSAVRDGFEQAAINQPVNGRRGPAEHRTNF